MTVAELIKVLKMAPSDLPVYFEGGEYKGDWREVQGAVIDQNFSLKGVLLKDTRK
ncbi:hypothetical protein IB265_32760 [Ensifer sp. ENS10]|uniref:hypothetical protein n=1 Tax=Ensifer sp. ENS10 TaxID=2769286 RepID=UPI00177BC66A|nr:hypothetical protein [Ensifer sp. ENS10]MBD9511529.1 hypothetical protein [Ensifer sp. ENS10]